MILYTLLTLASERADAAPADPTTTGQSVSLAVELPSADASAPVSPSASGQPRAAAAPAEANGITLLRFQEDLNVASDLMLEGLLATQTIPFSLPRGWALRADPVLDLRFDHSATLIPERSILTVNVNGSAIASVPLDESNNADGHLRARVPRALLEAYNTVQVQVVQHVSPDCEDPFDPSLWTRVLRSSVLEIADERLPVAAELLDFPFPFFDARGYGPARIALVDTGELLGSQLQALGDLGLTLGRHAAYRLVEVEPAVARLEDLKTNGLVVGIVGRQALLTQLVTQPLSSGQGYVGVMPVPHDPSLAVLVVAGADEEGLAAAVAALAGQDRSPLLSGAASVVSRVTVDAPPPSREEYQPAPWGEPSFTLASLGFEDRTVRGYYAETIRVPVQLEGDAEPNADGLVRLHYAHSALVDPRTSAVEVRLNGVVLRSRNLDAESRPQTLDVELPRTLIQRKNDLEVFFHLFPLDFDACRRVSDRQLWATVFADSVVTVGRDHWAEMPDLSRLDTGLWPFSLDAAAGGTAIVVADTPTVADASAAFQLATELGRTSVVADPVLSVVVGGTPTPGKNVVLLSTPGRAHARFDRLRADGSLTVGGETARELGGAGALLTAQVGTPYATVEEAMNPEEPSRGVLALRGANLLAAVRGVTRPDRVGQLFGNASVLPADGPARPLDVVDRVPVGTRSFRSRVQAAVTGLWPFVGMAVPLAALLAAWVISRWARARGGTT